MTDIDREKLRELCERRNKIIKMYGLHDHPLEADIVDDVLPLLDLTDAQAEKIDNLSRSLDHANVCLDGYASTHEQLLTLCEPACGRDLPIPDRVERLAQMYKEQAAKIAELKAENAGLRERANAPEDLTWFWEIVDRDGLANVGSDERQALADLCRHSAERDQLRKQVDGLTGVMNDLVNWCKALQERGFTQATWYGFEIALKNAASALEQKEQG